MILSVDVGIKNLAMCVMSCSDKKDMKTYKIHYWNNCGVLETERSCQSELKNGKTCGKKCSRKFGIEVYCKRHSPKDVVTKSYSPKKIDRYLLQDIVELLVKKLKEIISENNELFKSLKAVYIELQPKVNNKMKLMSHVIYTHLVTFFMDCDGGASTTVRFLTARNKLKNFKGPNAAIAAECKLKTPYSRRKWLSINYTDWYLQNSFCEEEMTKWLPIFDQNKSKKDDLGDVFNMCISILS
jgi:hypothetical protein